MAVASPASPRSAAIDMRRRAWSRDLRLWAGIVLFVFLATHLLNHGLALFGMPLAEFVQDWRIWVWRSWPGTIALYGAFAVHALLALRRVARRRSLRMPFDEALQIALGLMIPFLALGHVSATRYAGSYLGADESYTVVFARILFSSPLFQILLVSIAWSHGCIGIYQALRAQVWFPRWRDALLLAAVVTPLFGVAGFLSGGREALAARGPPAADSPEDAASLMRVRKIARDGFLGVLGALIVVMGYREVQRRRGGLVTIRYTGHGLVRIPKGISILEASRMSGFPHPSRCGGRARCSTCRVLVTAGFDDLPEPTAAERKLLERISAPANVRLACQLRPTADLALQILLPVSHGVGRALRHGDDSYRFGLEQEVTVLVVDMRAFNTLASRQLPHDLVLVLNRFLAELTQAVEAHDGRVDMLLTDGLTALFGLNGKRGAGSREALRAARDILNVVDAMDRELGSALPIPLRVGIGVHTGKAVVAQIGSQERGVFVTALGEAASVAYQLEAATKYMLVDCLVSEATLRAGGLSLPGAARKEAPIRGRPEPLVAYALTQSSKVVKTADLTPRDTPDEPRPDSEDDGAPAPTPAGPPAAAVAPGSA